MRLLAFALSLATMACADSDAPGTSISVGEARYEVPESHIRSLSREPHQFIRIKDPESSFELVYDSRTTGRKDRVGWPSVFSLNDEQAPNVERYSAGDLMVICRKAVHPQDGCGLKLPHRGVEWTVLFPTARLQEAPEIRQQAVHALNAYAI